MKLYIALDSELGAGCAAGRYSEIHGSLKEANVEGKQILREDNGFEIETMTVYELVPRNVIKPTK